MKSLLLLGLLGFTTGAPEFLRQTDTLGIDIQRLLLEASAKKYDLMTNEWDFWSVFNYQVREEGVTWRPELLASWDLGALALSTKTSLVMDQWNSDDLSLRSTAEVRGKWKIFSGFRSYGKESQTAELERLGCETIITRNRILTEALRSFFQWESSTGRVAFLADKSTGLQKLLDEVKKNSEFQDPEQVIELQLQILETQSALERERRAERYHRNLCRGLNGNQDLPVPGKLQKLWWEIPLREFKSLLEIQTEWAQRRDRAWDLKLDSDQGPTTEFFWEFNSDPQFPPSLTGDVLLHFANNQKGAWVAGVLLRWPLSGEYPDQGDQLRSYVKEMVNREEYLLQVALVKDLEALQGDLKNITTRVEELGRLREVYLLRQKVGEATSWETGKISWRLQEEILYKEEIIRTILLKSFELLGRGENLSLWIHKEE